VEIKNKQENDKKEYREWVINISMRNNGSSHVMSCANPSASIHVKAKESKSKRSKGQSLPMDIPPPKVPSKTPR
jgi:hypothetical protein